MQLRSCSIGALFLAVLWQVPFANAMVFLARDAEVQSYERYLVATNQESYTQWISKRALNVAAGAHDKVLEFAQSVLSQAGPISEKTRTDWTNLRLAEDLNAEDRELLLLLAEKINLSKEACRLLLLQPSLADRLANPGVRPKCEEEAIAIPSGLASKVGPRELVQIDGVLFTGDHLPKRLVPGPYRWKIFSNSLADRTFVGSAKDFEAAQLATTPWVQGSCGDGSLDAADFSVQSQAKLFFSADCVDPALKPARSFSTWAHEHERLLWGLGILAVGLTAYQLRDKNVVFTRN